MSTAPAVISVRRDAVHREIRLELADWNTRTGGVYDLSGPEQEALMLPDHLPPAHDFLPDFVIVYATGEPTTTQTPDGPVETVTWTDLRIHVGGVGRDAISNAYHRRGFGAHTGSTEYSNLASITAGTYRRPPAPAWLLDLVRDHTPWGALLDTTGASR